MYVHISASVVASVGVQTFTVVVTSVLPLLALGVGVALVDTSGWRQGGITWLFILSIESLCQKVT